MSMATHTWDRRWRRSGARWRNLVVSVARGEREIYPFPSVFFYLCLLSLSLSWACIVEGRWISPLYIYDVGPLFYMLYGPGDAHFLWLLHRFHAATEKGREIGKRERCVCIRPAGRWIPCHFTPKFFSTALFRILCLYWIVNAHTRTAVDLFPRSRTEIAFHITLESVCLYAICISIILIYWCWYLTV